MRTSKTFSLGTKLAFLAALTLVFVFSLFTVRVSAGESYTVQVDSGYLALRSDKAYDKSNEIGKLYTGDKVDVQDKSGGQYWWVYAPSLGKSGYVNKDYLVSKSNPTPTPSYIGTATVKVESGYLALRNAKAYDKSNEIGKLYTNESIQILNTSEGKYWWVYAPTLGKQGYVNSDYLINIKWTSGPSGNTYTVKVASGYLALRNAKAYDSKNEIGKLYTGETVEVQDKSTGQYWWVYAPSLGKSGYVNSDYLIQGGSSSSYIGTATAKVASGYLALRNAKAYDSKNEIGKLYTGDQVQIISTSEGLYWWVYAPTLGKTGYVNSDYLTNITWTTGPSSDTMTVKVASGYLALRNAMAYDSKNEIGKLYTGDKVQIVEKKDKTYWWVYAPSLGKYGYVNSEYLY